MRGSQKSLSIAILADGPVPGHERVCEDNLRSQQIPATRFTRKICAQILSCLPAKYSASVPKWTPRMIPSKHRSLISRGLHGRLMESQVISITARRFRDHLLAGGKYCKEKNRIGTYRDTRLRTKKKVLRCSRLHASQNLDFI